MITVGSKLPDFRLKAVADTAPGREFREISSTSDSGDWLVLFFWPMDFTFVCPTEIAAFGARHDDFRARGARVLGASTDTEYVHLAWRQSHAALRDLPFPMLADTRRELANALGILHPEEGVAMRATFIVDPTRTVRFVSVTDLSVGRNVDEVLRVLDALQCGDLTPCNWQPGQPTLTRKEG